MFVKLDFLTCVCQFGGLVLWSEMYGVLKTLNTQLKLDYYKIGRLYEQKRLIWSRNLIKHKKIMFIYFKN